MIEDGAAESTATAAMGLIATAAEEAWKVSDYTALTGPPLAPAAAAAEAAVAAVAAAGARTKKR